MHQSINPPIQQSKQKFPRALALSAAGELCKALLPWTQKLICAGSLRRRKDHVGDVELLFIPAFETVPDGLFETIQVSLVDRSLAHLLELAIIDKRKNSLGSEIWGDKNKLARHLRTGVPIDLFTATHENWFNYLVCRTGPAESNIRIASAAKAQNWQWNPYSPGFTDQHGNIVPVTSEQDVFRLVNLPYLEPHER
jgi:DNA polymerase/3'-5' exonuclease PolX